MTTDAPAAGIHEVMIECPFHESDPLRLDAEQSALAFLGHRERLNTYALDGRWNFATVFRNVGADAGASLEHLHSQLMALPEPPPDVEGFWQRERDSHPCLTCTEIGRSAERRFAENESFIAVTSEAPRFDYEFWIAPKRHTSDYRSVSDAGIVEFNELLRTCLTALAQVAGAPAYNLVLHESPLRGERRWHHWRWDVLPRTATPAGFELGTGAAIVATPPEAAAAAMRAVL